MSGHDRQDHMWTETYRQYVDVSSASVADPLARWHPVLRLRSWQSRLEGVGSCLRCRHSWRVVQLHSTYYTASRGCFPLCEGCWRPLTPTERLPYYDRLVTRWARGRPTDNFDTPWDVVRSTIRKAVLAGG